MRYVGIGKETGFGNPTTPTRYLDPLSVSIAADKEPILRRGIGSRWPVDKALGNIVVSGDMEFPANPEIIGDFLLMLLGKVETSQPDPTGAPNVYAHIFKPCEVGESPPTYTIEIGLDSTARRITSAILGSMSLEFAPGEYVSVTASILAQKEDSTDLKSPSFPAARDWHSGDVSAVLGGQEVELKALTLEINNNPSSDHHVIGSRYLPRHELGELEITGSMDVKFVDRDHLDRFLNDEETSLTITLTGDEIEGGQNHQLKLELPRIVYSAWSGDVDSPEMIIQSIDFVAIKPSSDEVFKATLTNTVNEY